MKIEFEDKSFIDCHKDLENEIIITIQARDYSNPLKKITNAVKLTKEEFQKLISDI